MNNPIEDISSFDDPHQLSISLKSNLEYTLNQATDLLIQYNEIGQNLNNYGIECDHYFPFQYLQKVVNNWIVFQCDQTAKIVNSDHPICFSRDLLPGHLASVTFDSSDRAGPSLKLRLHQCTYQHVIDYLLATYEFTSLAMVLSISDDLLKQQRYAHAANHLVDIFELENDPMKQPLSIRQQRGRHLLPFRIGHYQRLVSDLTSIHSSITVFDSETSDTTLSQCFAKALDQAKQLPHSEQFDSRHTVSFEAASITFFKKKCVLHLAPSLFESLIAFIQTYSPLKTRALSIQ